MNRRAILQAAVAAAMPFSAVKTGVAISCEEHRETTLVFVFTQQKMTPAQINQTQNYLGLFEDKLDCQFFVMPDCEGMAIVPGVGAAKYGATEKMGDYSFSVFCQTAEELEQWMPKYKKSS